MLKPHICMCNVNFLSNQKTNNDIIYLLIKSLLFCNFFLFNNLLTFELFTHILIHTHNSKRAKAYVGERKKKFVNNSLSKYWLGVFHSEIFLLFGKQFLSDTKTITLFIQKKKQLLLFSHGVFVRVSILFIFFFFVSIVCVFDVAKK